VPTRLASFASVASLCVAAFLVSGCSTPAEPAGPEPVFSSDAEAFAAAEATYRAYVDALNDVDLSDPATFEPVFALTTGELNASDRKGLSTYHADGFRVDGASEIALVSGLESDPVSGATSLAVCLDVSSIEVTRPDGSSAVSPDRVDVQQIQIDLVHGTDQGLVIEAVRPREGEPLCD
jgi:hypothetical protein